MMAPVLGVLFGFLMGIGVRGVTFVGSGGSLRGRGPLGGHRRRVLVAHVLIAHGVLIADRPHSDGGIGTIHLRIVRRFEPPLRRGRVV